MTTAAPISPSRPWAGGMPLAMYPPNDQEFVLRTQRASARIQEITNGNGKPEVGACISGSPTDGVPTTHKPTVQLGGNTSSALNGTAERSGWYDRPRRLSNNSEASSTVASSAVFDGESFDGRIRTMSMSSSHTSVDSYPIGGPQSPAAQPRWQTPSNTPLIMGAGNAAGPCAQSYPWQKPAPIKQYRKKAQGELFAALPGEVLELMLEELRKLHLGQGRNSCATCWMRDCCSVALSARKCLKYAREALYGHIHIVGHEGPAIKKRTKTTYGSRLILLRRTLRSNAQIAVIVRSLKPPALPQGVGLTEYNDLVASVIMACPSLERLIGYYPTFNHSFQRIFQALSTRPKLKEMSWILEPSPSQQQQRSRPGGPNSHWGPVDLTRQEAQGFLDFNVNWKHLTTLVIHCHLGATLSPPNLLDRTVRSLPALQNLYLSHLPHSAFNDSSLLALPPLKTLSLAHCTGVTTNGLSALATRRNSNSLHTLTLIHMNIESLPAIARLFSYLYCLETFNIVQTITPAIPPDEFIMLFPYLACRTLKRLHWDIPYLPTQSTPSDTILAKSISAGGFPALRYLCAPNDPEGIFQAVCQPREKVDLAGDRFRGRAHSYGHAHANSTSSRRPSSSQAWQGFGSGHHRNSSTASSQRSGSALGFWGSSNRSRSGSRSGSRGGNTPPPVSPLFPPPDALDMMARDNSDLHQARMAAQARIDQAKKYPRFFIQVFDEGGTMREKYGVGAFVGTVGSKVRYVLTPNEGLGQTDEGGGLVTVEDMIRDDGGEALVLGGGEGDGGSKKKKGAGVGEREGGEKRTREGCTGRWNTYSGMVVDKKDKERWWHQERGRWRQAVPS
ncbi:uncharacterized protein QC761_118130 [Podospora bellae-mahoneyi]|uniref:F-box domain-containing protein n=1 Tax=Podospora bellae-mahoneyi TaxID=2093777 RepID=A0ABR0G0W1_9PEZI|nr:hypothetical protein QC761_118130 [Podospora bellae-mahoneyi]